MKNSSEWISDIHEKAEKRFAQQKKRRKMIVSISSSAACLALVLCSVIAVPNLIDNNLLTISSKTPSANQTLDNAHNNNSLGSDHADAQITTSPSSKENLSESPSTDESGKSNTMQASDIDITTNQQNKIVFNQIVSVNSVKSNIALLCDDFIEMSIDEVNQYYGVNVVPDVPDDMAEKPNQTYGIFKRNGGTGEVYYEQNGIQFSNKDFSKQVTVAVAKNRLPFFDVVYESVEEVSTINNIEILFGETEYGELYADFLYRNVGFSIFAAGISRNEFVNIVASIL
ncbi:MAG: hypothetical protein PUB00_05060 [Clostridiales bacterium]|nr:hypothetical protein [Clostridiales bacterium]